MGRTDWGREPIEQSACVVGPERTRGWCGRMLGIEWCYRDVDAAIRGEDPRYRICYACGVALRSAIQARMAQWIL